MKEPALDQKAQNAMILPVPKTIHIILKLKDISYTYVCSISQRNRQHLLGMAHKATFMTV